MTTMAVKMIRLAPDLMVPVDRLPADLRRRWDIAQSKSDNGENVKGIIETLLREISGVVGVDTLMRAAQKAPQSLLTLGTERRGDETTVGGGASAR